MATKTASHSSTAGCPQRAAIALNEVDVEASDVGRYRIGHRNLLELIVKENLSLTGLFEAAIAAATSSKRGCMISTGLVEGAHEQQDLAREPADRRAALRDAIAGVLGQWFEQGGAQRLAAYLTAVLQGLSVQARDGATVAELSAIADEARTGILAKRVIASESPAAAG